MRKTRGLPLATMVTSTVVLLILAATATVATTAYLSSNASVDELWNDLAANLTDRTTKETLLFLEPAVPFVASSDQLMRRGHLDGQRPEELLTHLEVALDANPTFTWASWGGADGTYLSVFRWPVDGVVRVRRTWRRVISVAAPDAGGTQTWQRDWERQPDGRWQLIRDDRLATYDPRTRPWYRQGATLAPGEGVWVDPFLFTSRQQPGVSYVRSTRDAAGRVLGVWAAEFEGGPMSDFLGTLEVGISGRVYLLDRAGRVVAHPRGDVIGLVDGKPDILRANAHYDPLLAGAWHALPGRDAIEPGGPAEVFEFGEFLALAKPFPADSQIPWLVLTVVPSDDFFGEVRAQARKSLLIAILAVVLAIVFGVYLSRILSRSIARLRDELGRIAQFDLSEQRLSDAPTAVRELNSMSRAADTMKDGLRSFGRYVPYQLVRHLLASGREAVLGGESRELTVLFSDIAGFTPIVESTPADQVLTALGEYLAEMNVQIAETNGTVCQYLGDGIMAFWGAPDSQEDHALRACLGALAMRKGALALAETAPERGRPVFRTRYGLNTGEVMVGNIGAPTRFNYGILGDAVNTASRLEGLNKVYSTEIIIGERTAELVRDAVVVRPIDWVRAKGKQKPMLLHQLLGTPDEIPAATRAGIVHYEAGLSAYRERRFDAAIEWFHRAADALAQDADQPDRPCEIMVARCEAYLSTPPGPDWDGVHQMTTK